VEFRTKIKILSIGSVVSRVPGGKSLLAKLKADYVSLCLKYLLKVKSSLSQQ